MGAMSPELVPLSWRSLYVVLTGRCVLMAAATQPIQLPWLEQVFKWTDAVRISAEA